jgi:hypothetical protein
MRERRIIEKAPAGEDRGFETEGWDGRRGGASGPRRCLCRTREAGSSGNFCKGKNIIAWIAESASLDMTRGTDKHPLRGLCGGW